MLRELFVEGPAGAAIKIVAGLKPLGDINTFERDGSPVQLALIGKPAIALRVLWLQLRDGDFDSDRVTEAKIEMPRDGRITTETDAGLNAVALLGRLLGNGETVLVAEFALSGSGKTSLPLPVSMVIRPRK